MTIFKFTGEPVLECMYKAVCLQYCNLL